MLYKIKEKVNGDKGEYVIQTRNLKHALNHGLVLERYIKSLNLIKKLS